MIMQTAGNRIGDLNHLLKYTLHYNSVHYYFTNEEYYAKCR